MIFSYGDHSQFDAGVPQCGAFAQHPSLHYLFFYYMPVMTIFAIAVNGFVMWVLWNNKSLMNQSQHVYVLGNTITNLCVAIGCNIPAWIDTLLLPCVYLGGAPCFVYNIFNFAGGYQLMTNVCLICYDRWRLVRFGAAYEHSREVRRAKWLLCGTAILNLVIFVAPELIVPMLTGVMYDFDFPRCRAAQGQYIPQLHFDMGHFLGWVMIAVPWAIVALFTVMTIGKLRRIYKKASKEAAAAAISQVADGQKMLRASLVMFGMVTILLLTFGPLALGFILLDTAPYAISWYQVQCLLYLQFTGPALEPFVFAITLPKLRKSVRATFVGRQLIWVSAKFEGIKRAAWLSGKTTTVNVASIATPHQASSSGGVRLMKAVLPNATASDREQK